MSTPEFGTQAWFLDILRRDHQGSGDAFGHWGCSCGISGGGTGPNARDWHRGHNMHLRAELRKLQQEAQST